jgi:hypothetical protein
MMIAHIIQPHTSERRAIFVDVVVEEDLQLVMLRMFETVDDPGIDDRRAGHGDENQVVC